MGWQERFHRWTWERATPAQRAAAYSGWKATFRYIWHRWTMRTPK